MECLMVNKAFCESRDGSSGSSTSGKEVKSLSRVSVHSRKNSTVPSMLKVVQCSRCALEWLAADPREWCHVGNSGLVFAVGSCVFNCGFRQIGLGVCKSIVLNPGIIFTSAALAAVLMDLLGRCQD